MGFIENIKLKAKENKKRIVLPESIDERVIEAASKILEEDIADIILIGNINSSKYDITKATIIDPNTSDLTDRYVNELYELRKEKGMTIEEARRLLTEDYMYYACMLVKDGKADGVVSGACHSTANTLRPALQIVKTDPQSSFVSSFFLMEVPNSDYGLNGTFIFSDCGLVEYPSSEQLAEIAYSSANSFKKLVNNEPIVAMLSYSSMGSAKGEYVNKVSDAVKIAKEKYSNYKIDGELQLDAAIVPEVANLKASNSDVAGKANVLIFPNLDAGNIGYKLVQRLAKANAYGPITQGMAAPINDLSRGCSADDIVGAVAITCVQAQN